MSDEFYLGIIVGGFIMTVLCYLIVKIIIYRAIKKLDK